MSRFVVVVSAVCPDRSARPTAAITYEHHLRTYTVDLDAGSLPQAQTLAVAEIRKEFGCVDVRIIEVKEAIAVS